MAAGCAAVASTRARTRIMAATAHCARKRQVNERMPHLQRPLRPPHWRAMTPPPAKRPNCGHHAMRKSQEHDEGHPCRPAHGPVECLGVAHSAAWLSRFF